MNEAENTEHDYLLFMRNTKYTDIANSLSKYDYYNYIIEYDKNDISHDDIYNIILKIKNIKELYFFVTNLTLTKKYCHMILNNKKVLKLFNNKTFLSKQFKQDYNYTFIDKYYLMFKYIIGYAWIIFYTEESIKKSNIDVNDRFVYDIDTASLLPSFYFPNNNPKMSPYFSVLIDNDILDYSKNINSFGSIYSNNRNYYKISTLTEFEEKLNIFCNYKYNNKLFNNIDWTNIAISGSVMAACIPQFNPLQFYFSDNTTNSNNFEDYIEHFYKESDIDVMCNCSNISDFVKTFFKFYNKLSDNVKNIDNDEILDYDIKKTSYFYIDTDIIYKLKIKLNMSEEDVKNNLNSDKIINEIYTYYLESHVNNINEYMGDELFNNKEYNFLFEPAKKDELVININKKVDNVYLFTNIKFIIHSTTNRVLRKNIEFFKIKKQNFFSSVSNFHLNCVRSYYNGNNVYMLPSCITAYKTYINIDLKYFAGNNSPYKIIEKYRFRGFATILNNDEKIAYVEYY